MTRLAGGASGSRTSSQSASTLQNSRKRMNWEQVLSDQPDDAETADNQEHKRRRLDEEGAEAVKKDEVEDIHHEANLEIGERCIICLMTLRDRTLVGPCKHSGFCVRIAYQSNGATAHQGSLSASESGPNSLASVPYVRPQWLHSCCMI